MDQHLVKLGIDPALARTLSKLRDLSSQNPASLTPDQLKGLTLLRRLGSKLQETQAFARLHGMATAFVEAFLVAAGFCALGVIMALFVREIQTQKVAWSREALIILQKFPPEFRVRAQRGFKIAAQRMGIKVVTPKLVVDIGRKWKSQ